MNAFANVTPEYLCNAGTWIEDQQVALHWQRKSVPACRSCGGLRLQPADGWCDSTVEPCRACLGTGFQLPDEFTPKRPSPSVEPATDAAARRWRLNQGRGRVDSSERLRSIAWGALYIGIGFATLLGIAAVIRAGGQS